MKHLKSGRRAIACVLCVVIMATLFLTSALANGFCSYPDSRTGIVCGRLTERVDIDSSGIYTASHTYYDAALGGIARCNYYYHIVSQADQCPVGHRTNFGSVRYEFDHACTASG